jgi:membrane fusion protein, multidrug efflux system
VANDQESLDSSATARDSKPFIVRHWKVLLILVLVIVAMIVLIRYIQQKQPVAGVPGAPAAAGRGGRPGGQNAPVAVSTATAAVGDIDIKIPALGTVTPLATVTVRTQISGIMQKLLFTEGQLVKQGDTLAQIDPRPYEAALQQQQGNLKRDQALLADAKLDLKRYEGLVKEDSIAQQQLDTQRALVDQYVGTVESDQGQLKTAEVNLIYTKITAPATGIVGLRQVDQGNYVTPGDTNGVVLLNQLQPITVIFAIPEDNVSAIAKRVNSGAALTVEAFDRTNSNKIADGKLLTLDNTIDITTGTVKLRAQFANEDRALFPNQFVNIQLLVDTLKNQVIMPNSAVRRGAPNGVTTEFVYIVNPDRTVSVRPVTLGVVDGERVAVVKGLAAGEMVVTEGADRLRDGAQVLLPNTKPPAGSADGAAAGAAGKAGGAAQGHHKRPGGQPPQPAPSQATPQSPPRQ